MYEIIIGKQVDTQLRKLQKRIYTRVMNKIYELADNPRPPGCTKLVDFDNAWRIRVGDYRVIYEVDDQQLQVLIVKFGHRKRVYR